MSRKLEIVGFMLLAVMFLPLIALLLPFIIWVRRPSSRRDLKVGLVVSGRWPDNLQYARLPYDLALFRAGAQVVTIKPAYRYKLRKMVEELDALVLTGGEDIDPLLYDAPREMANFINSERDDLEMELLNLAAEFELPTLAICRGSQLFAVKYGGRLMNIEPNSEDIHSFKLSSSIKFSGHHVNILPDTLLAKIFPQPVILTNSIHHQSIADAGLLKVAALSKDGCIEGVEHPEYDFMLGVQWHPELRAIYEPASQKLFDALVNVAKDKRVDKT